MLLYSAIVRYNDGLELAASTDSGLGSKYGPILKSSQPYIKLLAKRVASYPPRCSLCGDGFTIFFQHLSNVCVFAVCTNDYSYTLAFAFLQDILSEFTRVNNAPAIDSAIRPYEFLHFDTYLQKVKARYNGSNIGNRMSSFMGVSNDLTERPPYRIDIDTLDQTAISLKQAEKSSKPSIVPARHFTPLSCVGALSIVMNAVCSLLNIVRGMYIVNEGGFEIGSDDSGSYVHGAAFFLAALLCLYQIYLLRTFTRWRTTQSFLVLVCLLACHAYTSHERHAVQLTFHTVVAAFTTFHIVTRQLVAKLPAYNV